MQKRLQSSNGEPARHRDMGFTGQVGRAHRDGSLNAWMEPHQTDTTEALFHCDTNQWKAEAIERMGWISDLNRVGRECC
jgi:hypothetical protein